MYAYIQRKNMMDKAKKTKQNIFLDVTDRSGAFKAEKGN